MPNLREILNSGDPNRIAAALAKVKFGDVLNRLLGGSDVNFPAAITTADGTDATTTQALANATKAMVNLLRTSVVGALGVTQQALTVTSHVGTLSNTPSKILTVNATTATSAGIKTVRVGPTSGTGALVPAAGEVIWNGNKTLLFNTADNVTVADISYTRDADATVSVLSETIEV